MQRVGGGGGRSHCLCVYIGSDKWTPQKHNIESRLVAYNYCVILKCFLSSQQTMVEINFLCVHKKLRSKRVAPVLIKEITRRVNKESIFQAVYTAGVLIPKPISVCRYWHRSLNPKKLVDVQFSSLHRHMTLQRMIRLFRLPDVSRIMSSFLSVFSVFQ